MSVAFHNPVLIASFRKTILSFADPVHFWIERDRIPLMQNYRARPYVRCRNGTYQRRTITKAKIADHATTASRLHYCNDHDSQIWLMCLEIDNKQGCFDESVRFAEPIRRYLGSTYMEPSRGGAGVYVFFRFDRRGLTRDEGVAHLQALDLHLKSRFPCHCDGPKIDAIKGLPRKQSETFDAEYAKSTAVGWEDWFNDNWFDDQGWSYRSMLDHYLDGRRNRPDMTPVCNELEQWAFELHSSAPAPCGWRDGDGACAATGKLSRFLEWYEQAEPNTPSMLNIRTRENGLPVVATSDVEATRLRQQQAALERIDSASRLESILDQLYDELPHARPNLAKKIRKLIDWVVELDAMTIDVGKVRRKCFPRRHRGLSANVPQKIQMMLDTGNPWPMTRGCVMLMLQRHGNIGRFEICDWAMDLYETLPGRDNVRDRKRQVRFASAYYKAMWTFDEALIGPDHRSDGSMEVTDEERAKILRYFRSRFSGDHLYRLLQQLRRFGTSSKDLLGELRELYITSLKVIFKTAGALPTAHLRAASERIAACSGSKLKLLLEALDRFLICTDQRYTSRSSKTLMPDRVKPSARRYRLADKAPRPAFAMKYVPHEITDAHLLRYVSPERVQPAGPHTTSTSTSYSLPRKYWTNIEINFTPPYDLPSLSDADYVKSLDDLAVELLNMRN